jgi:putative transposase
LRSKVSVKVDNYAKTVGKLTVELEWTTKKLKSLDLSNKRDLVESKLKEISLSRQCELLSLSRGSIYYKPVINKNKEAIKNKIVEIFEEIPIYGYLKVHQQLLEYGFNVSANTVQTYRKELNLKAVLAVKAPNTSAPNKQHAIYSYKLKDIDITHANQVWSTDITYRNKGNSSHRAWSKLCAYQRWNGLYGSNYRLVF